jgi:hypothetical protein
VKLQWAWTDTIHDASLIRTLFSNFLSPMP